jgi:hypothetical protein
MAQKYWLWRRAVTGYTVRDLTDERDKLATISGIATVFGSRLNDQPVARLFKYNIADELAWWVYPDPGREDRVYYRRHIEYSGPRRGQQNWSYSDNHRPTKFKGPT